MAKKREEKIILQLEKAKDSHLVAAALVATVTFAAAFTLPGGYISDENNAEKGNPILSKNSAFKAFIISDTIAMALSISSVFIYFIMVMLGYKPKYYWLIKTAFRLIFLAMGAMVVAFVTGTYAVLAPSLGLAIAICAIGLSFFLFLFYIFIRLCCIPRYDDYADGRILTLDKVLEGMEVDFETNDIGSDDFEIAPGFTGSRFDILGDDDGVTIRENLLFDNSVAAAILPPSPFQGPDFVVWRFSSSGLFSLRTGYEWLEGLHDEHPGGVWNSVGIGKESHLHVLHDCSFTQQVWFDLRPPGAWDNFVATNPVDLWIGYNISSQQLHHSGYSWALIFGVTSISLQQTNGACLLRVERLISWQLPTPGAFKLNTNGSVRGCFASGGGLIRNDQVHGQILKFGHMSDYYITSAVVNMYSKCEAMELARQVFDESIDLNVVCWTSLASGYCSNGLMNEAGKMFDAMPERNEISFRAMVSGYVWNYHFNEAIELFQELKSCSSVKFSGSLLVSVLNACAAIGAFEDGKLIHSYVDGNGLD
ncbi:hypothetical protein GH714_030252 [Hevea brasiliensis]|uniref:PGG domain-containing protein n=1 Tax=Hevea brasiliensis TaxID=3981 RepID=A0A6A6MQ88_HEVBR|nr:hypothetical protein GH714_030252 [Hevea brasiliensis]